MSSSNASYGGTTPVGRVRLHALSLLRCVGILLLLVRIPCTLQAETQHTEEFEAQQNSAAVNAEAMAHTEAEPASISNVKPLPASTAARSEGEANAQETVITGAGPASVLAVAETASPTPAAEPRSPDLVTARESEGEVAGYTCHSCGEDAELATEGQPVVHILHSGRASENGEIHATTQPAESASTVSSGRGHDEAGKVRKRHKRRGSLRQETLCRRKHCYYLADSAFVSSAHVLPPRPHYTPPPTPAGKAFIRAVSLCHDSNFNLNIGKKYIYLISSAVTYFQQSRVKCAIAYAQLFREEDIPVPSEEVFDECAVALLRHSPDDCWVDVPDPRVVSMKGPPGTKLIGPPAKVESSDGELLNREDEIRRHQFKRAERLTLTLFQFSLTSRIHWCPLCKNEKPPTAEIRRPDLLPRKGYEGPKHEVWRKYLDALNEEVTRDLMGLPPAEEGEGDGSAAEDTSEMTGSSSGDTNPETTEKEKARDVFFSANFSLAPPWRVSRNLPPRQSWMSRRRPSPPERTEPRYRAGGRSGFGKIPAGAVFGGLTDTISRYGALLNYLQSRYNFQRLKYETAGQNPSTTADGNDSTSANARDGGIPVGTTQTLTLHRIDVVTPFGPTAGATHDKARSQQFFTLEDSNTRVGSSRRPAKSRSSCDLLPQDQAAEAARAALTCDRHCVDTGESLSSILEYGTHAAPADFTDTFWSQSNDSFRPTRLPRHPTAESLQRAYLNQLVSSCGAFQISLKEAEQFYFAKAASLHFFGLFHDRCLQAMDEMTLPLFTKVFADESRGNNVGMHTLQEFLPVPAPYSGADQLLVNCAAAGLVPSAMPPTSLSDAATSAEAIAAAAAATGAPPWGAPTKKTRAALEASVFAFHHPVRGLMGRNNLAPRIQCWEFNATNLPPRMSQTEFRSVVSSFADVELRRVPTRDRRFLDEQLAPTVLHTLLQAKLPARIFLGYNSAAARTYVLARYMRAMFKLDTPDEAGWKESPPRTLSVEDQTVKAVDVAVNCGVACSDIGLSAEDLIRNGLEAYLTKRGAIEHEGVDFPISEKGHAALGYAHGIVPAYKLNDETYLRGHRAAPSGMKQELRKVPRRTSPVSHNHLIADEAHAFVVVQKGLQWIPAIVSLTAALL